jgi:type IV pilus assembly protein PilB
VPKFRRRDETATLSATGTDRLGEQQLPPSFGTVAEPPPDTSIHESGDRLGEVLVREQLVPRGRLAEALLQQHASGKRLGELLLELGVLDERGLAAALAAQTGLELVDLHDVEVEPTAVSELPESVARSCVAVPLRRTDTGIEIAFAEPDRDAIAQVEAAVEQPVVARVAPVGDVRRLLDREYRALAGVSTFVGAFEATQQIAAEATRDGEDVGVDAAPIVQVVNLILTQALRDRASDVHVEPQEGRLRIRYRIDGVLHDVLALPSGMAPALVSRIKIQAGMNIVERRRAQDGQIALELEGRSVDIRVATTATIWGEKAVLRLLDKSRTLFRLEDLGMPAETSARYEELTASPFGMVVCTGPTGSGKTTTLYATLSELNRPEVNIITIEDPVEYILPSVNQIQVNEAADITFASSLRSSLRQDPDVILVGEIRDTETAQIAIRAALTGHFVASSLHATDAAAAITRFVDMGVEPFLLASALRAVVAQRLVRRVCDGCATTYTPTADELAFFHASGGSRSKHRFVRGEGCNFCSGSGYRDRIGVYELLPLTDEIRSLLVANAPREQLRAAAIADGMTTLLAGGMRLVERDVTTVAEVVRAIHIV